MRNEHVGLWCPIGYASMVAGPVDFLLGILLVVVTDWVWLPFLLIVSAPFLFTVGLGILVALLPKHGAQPEGLHQRSHFDNNPVLRGVDKQASPLYHIPKSNFLSERSTAKMVTGKNTNKSEGESTLFRWATSLAIIVGLGVFTIPLARGLFLAVLNDSWRNPLLALPLAGVVIFVAVTFLVLRGAVGPQRKTGRK